MWASARATRREPRRFAWQTHVCCGGTKHYKGWQQNERRSHHQKNNSRKEKKTRTVLLSFFIPATGTHAQATYGTKRETEKKRGNELQQESQVRAITLSWGCGSGYSKKGMAQKKNRRKERHREGETTANKKKDLMGKT